MDGLGKLASTLDQDPPALSLRNRPKQVAAHSVAGLAGSIASDRTSISPSGNPSLTGAQCSAASVLLNTPYRVPAYNAAGLFGSIASFSIYGSGNAALAWRHVLPPS